MAASFTKSILKLRTSKGAKSVSDAEWALGWVAHLGVEAGRQAQSGRVSAPEGSAGEPAPAPTAPARKRRHHKHHS